MINKWTLNNFKSIDKPTELAFRPLTIFTGANSSGKSTVLQSILMVTQTMQSPILTRSIVLNGSIKKFGSYSDIVNHRDLDKNIKVGFEIAAEDSPVAKKRNIQLDSNERVKQLECEFEVSSDGIADNLQPTLESVSYIVQSMDPHEAKSTLALSRGIDKAKEEQDIIRLIGNGLPSRYFEYGFSDLKANCTFHAPVNSSMRILGADLSHFIPSAYIAYSRMSDVTAEYVDECMQGFRSSIKFSKDDKRKMTSVLKPVALAIAEDIRQKGKFHQFNDHCPFLEKYNSLKSRFSLGKLHELFLASTLEQQEKQEYISQLKKACSIFERKVNIHVIPVDIFGTDFLKSFFVNNIRYLAPLREEPKSFYPLEGNGLLTDVGQRGENTAAVYENNKNKEILFIDPACFAKTADSDFTPRKGTLAEAINTWLVYMGVAEAVNTNDRGKIGHELKISSGSDLQTDLTHVGVGVSQVLPILVMAFLAKRGDVIILEQPELHLHPKVQTRLADFFVSMSALGKQCVIETHSEYMINRLRYHVAVSDNSRIADDTMIYFVEKDKESGCSNYRPVTINRYGVIEDWPDGFFDESERIAGEILRAGMAKRMQEEGDQEDDE